MTGIVGEGVGHIEGHLLPVSRRIEVASALRFSNDVAIAIQHGHVEVISTGMACARGIGVPPVAHRDLGCTIRYGEVLRDAVITVAVAAEIGAVLAAMGVGRIDEFIAIS